MILFVDNDVILKLTACDLFWDATACLGFQDSGLRVLNTAKFVFERNRRVKKNYSEQVRQRAIATVKKLTQVSATPDNSFTSVKYDGLDQAKVTPVRDCDNVLRAAFGSGLLSIESDSLFTLNEYIAQIEKDCPNLLMQT